MAISAGFILYRDREVTNELEFFVIHPGGPFYKNTDIWFFPKGGIEESDYPTNNTCNDEELDEEKLLIVAAWRAAIREFTEETGDLGLGFKSLLPNCLGIVKQSPHKRVVVFAHSCHWDLDPNKCKSIDIKIEHPSKSGNFITVPENDKFAWMTLGELRGRTHEKYIPLFESLTKKYSKK